MRIKKAGGKIFGADLTAAEKKAMDMEIQRQLAEYDNKHRLEFDALILWVLHAEFGFGRNRLKRFYDCFESSIDDLIARYDLENQDDIWLCTHKLKEIGVDIEAWNREK